MLGPAAPRVTAVLRGALALLFSAQACADNEMSAAEMKRSMDVSLRRIAPETGASSGKGPRDAVRASADALKAHLCACAIND